MLAPASVGNDACKNRLNAPTLAFAFPLHSPLHIHTHPSLLSTSSNRHSSASSDSLFSSASANSSLSPICFPSLDIDRLHSFPSPVWQGLRLRVNRYQRWLAWIQARRYRVCAFLPPPLRLPVSRSHPRSPPAGHGPERRWRCFVVVGAG